MHLYDMTAYHMLNVTLIHITYINSIDQLINK